MDGCIFVHCLAVETWERDKSPRIYIHLKIVISGFVDDTKDQLLDTTAMRAESQATCE
jgi:hypothetical protein